MRGKKTHSSPYLLPAQEHGDMERTEGGTEACKIRWFCKSEGAEANPNSQDPARGAGCALARAPVRSATSWALLRRPTRYRRPGPAPGRRWPIAARLAARPAPPVPAAGRGGCCTRRPGAASGENLPGWAPAASGLPARPRRPPRLEGLAPRLGRQQQVGSSASGLRWLPNCSLALGKVSYPPPPSPTLPLF